MRVSVLEVFEGVKMHNKEHYCGSKLINVSVCGDWSKVRKTLKVGCRKPILGD